MDFVERNRVYEEIIIQQGLSQKREKLFNEDFNDFYTNKSFDYLPTFLGEQKKRVGLNEDYLLKSSTLILSLESRDEPSVNHLASQSGKFLSDCVEYLRKGYKASGVLEGEMVLIIEKYLSRREKENLKMESEDGLGLCNDISVRLLEMVNWDSSMEMPKKYLVKMFSGVNVMDRRQGLERMREIGSFSSEFNMVRSEILSEMLKIMDPDQSLEIVDSMEKHICGEWINDLDSERKDKYWKSFAQYCKRRSEAGYSNEEIYEKLFDLEARDFKYDMPEELKSMIADQGREVDIVTLEKANLENVWRELCGNYSIYGVRDVLDRAVKFDEKCELLASSLPNESAEVCKFLAQALSPDMGVAYGDDGWRDWKNRRDINYSELLSSPAIKLVWEKVKDNPIAFGYQMSFWLASFPAKSLAEIGLDRVDVIEKVNLDTDSVGLCGLAEMYMQESLNLDNVVVLGEGKMLLKREGHIAALCLSEFVGSDNKVFKRGCFYVPQDGQKFRRTKPLDKMAIDGGWVFDRVARSNIIPLASEGLLHLADRWLEKHGYKK